MPIYFNSDKLIILSHKHSSGVGEYMNITRMEMGKLYKDGNGKSVPDRLV
jgi:hypothetical protein